MKPTDAGTDKNSPDNHKPKIPPIAAKGTLQNTSVACSAELKVKYSNKKIRASAIGTTIANRADALC
ncbi:hypothetical protein LBMAG20_10660 [Methylocystaceae bacterium]|nr:hypothetical protein LBMAG20_10660 [Methylocystaceae bacterium]